jgi:hypothetical protein
MSEVVGYRERTRARVTVMLDGNTIALVSMYEDQVDGWLEDLRRAVAGILDSDHRSRVTTSTETGDELPQPNRVRPEDAFVTCIRVTWPAEARNKCRGIF